ncbi:MAG: hypothetical protein CXZ00_04850 [Acidobacteria bacterium]|nr:MAG: hypothetical protein CXZ00_04850 [Acidobacteriota bacterium]
MPWGGCFHELGQTHFVTFCCHHRQALLADEAAKITFETALERVGKSYEWEWSSWPHYATGRQGRVEIESEWTAKRRNGSATTICNAAEKPHSSQTKA